VRSFFANDYIATYTNIVEPLAFELFDPNGDVLRKWSKLDKRLLQNSSKNPILYFKEENISTNFN
jgi:hypothetical protein